MHVNHYRNVIECKYKFIEFGKCLPIKQCCREIRLGSESYQEGEIYSGYNTLTEELEDYLCIVKSKKAENTQMQRIRGLRYLKEYKCPVCERFGTTIYDQRQEKHIAHCPACGNETFIKD